MKNILIKSALFTGCVVALVNQAPQAAVAGGIGNNYVAPAVTFGNGNTTFSIQSKFGVADSISLRPFVSFPSGGTRFGTSLTYDWDLRQSPLPLTPFIGLGVDVGTGSNSNTTGYAQIGADLNVNENIALLGSVAIPFSSNNNSTTVSLGAGLRF